jgi:hypothetical protein
MIVYKGRNVFPITGQSILPVLKGESSTITRTEGQFGEETYGRASVYSADGRWRARWTEPPFGPMDGHRELGQWQTYMTRVGGVEEKRPQNYY